MRKYGPMSGTKPPKGPDKKLSDMEDRFCHEYVIDLNATAAAKRAGYSAKTAHVQGPRLMQKVSVRSLVDKLLAERRAKAKMTADEVLEELAKLARSNIKRLFVTEPGDDGQPRTRMLRPDEMHDDDAAAIAGMEVITDPNGVPILTVKTKHWDKHAALRTLAQIHKLIGAEVEVNLGNDIAQRLAEARKRARKA